MKKIGRFMKHYNGYHVSSMGRALHFREDGPGFESRLRPDKTYYLCSVD